MRIDLRLNKLISTKSPVVAGLLSLPTVSIRVIATSIVALSLLVSGCDKQAASNSGVAAKTKIVVATSGAPKPFVYIDANNQLVGYDIDVVNAIFAKLPQYEVSFEKTEFPSVLAGLDSERYQIGANNFAMNEKRKQKYIYTDAIFKNQFVIAIAANNQSIHSFDDIGGKSSEVTPGLNYATALENYNQNHPQQPVKITYTEADLIVVLQNVASGKYDFQLIDQAMLKTFIQEHGLALKYIVLNDEEAQKIASPYSYLLISQGQKGQQLAQDVNSALKQAIDDGTLTNISQKYFGADFSPSKK